ncbi:hypothetical protein GLOTRDRAFT_135098 [Gloeophyllum trabeum ATCC 11539]|uniref:Nuclear pore complex protein NUP96 C-terminal domain-containing protein n=1 Tax=Gloeophyllum trabeum (strain ATCC 11539 / FP-39264 / Madison 617) TaxID=670483 RepID=S7QKS1_GLOTA|nr:uncharacterized protein GLOTRDRAFT_135098 [Gloeophyllum trabeum ATCC 11539]EPQ60401.1 hypothetical protein GLOTRDRAFT_135098 [Gloeophyllum trabeum ATCC 11539]
MVRFTAFESDTESDEDIQLSPDSSLRRSIGLRAPSDDEDSEAEVEREAQAQEAQDEEQDEAPVEEEERPREGRSSPLRASDLETPQSSLVRRPPSPPRQPPLPPDRALTPWARSVGVDPQKMKVMQSVFFRLPEQAEALKAEQQQQQQKQAKTPRAQSALRKSMKMSRKHGRESDGEMHRFGSQERVSFETPVVGLAPRPVRKFTRISTSESTVLGKESLRADAGLALGRSFRVGWGPGGKLAHVGTLCTPSASPKPDVDLSTVTVTSLPIEPEPLAVYRGLLQQHFNIAVFQLDASDIPFATHSPSAKLGFSTFLSALSDAGQTGSFEESLFRLGHALFDDLDPRLGASVPAEVRGRILALRRKHALSRWLQDAVAPAVERDLRERAALGDASKAFLHMTGNQIARACDVAMEGGYAKLATLIAQAGGDEDFRADILQQLEVWREEKVEGMIEAGVKKVYALLAGALGEHEVWKDLDWKRAFGLCLWFGQNGEAGIADAFKQYTDAYKGASEGAGMTPPLPWYAEAARAKSPWKVHKNGDPPDILYSLIRLYADPTCSLATILTPLSCSPSPLDYAMCWHLYILLSRIMRLRDFPDRARPPRRRRRSEEDEEGYGEEDEESEEEEEAVEGHSPTADLLASMYAHQLERAGRLEPAIFVLLHIEGSEGRERAIKEVLLRSVDLLEDGVVSNLIGVMKIPLAWINEAKALRALSKGRVWEAYELYKAALLYEKAHDLAVRHLAPEAAIRGDMDLLKQLFQGMEGKVAWYNMRGKIFVDYADIGTTLPPLLFELRAEPNAIPDAAQKFVVENMSNLIPRLIGLLPDILSDRSDPRHRAALRHMTGKLMSALAKLKAANLTQTHIQIKSADEGARLEYLHASLYENFLNNMRTVTASA